MGGPVVDKSELTVHLDHLIYRESLRWVENTQASPGWPTTQVRPLHVLKYRDLLDDETSLFPLLRKPDFQRETSAWKVSDCVALLESVVNQLIVPSVIVWRNPENRLLYILDGSHRVSVVRAWMLDDWGDKAEEGYYERHEYVSDIKLAAQLAREEVNRTIGAFADFVKAGKRFLAKSKTRATNELSEDELKRGYWYSDMMTTDAGFHVQEVSGDYEVAESSFVRINRSGQELRDWEITLIENRNSSLARAIMSIANGGAGRFWPETVQDSRLYDHLAEIRSATAQIHYKLFVPPLVTPIRSANVPLIAATRYFPKHNYLLEFLPLIEGVGDIDALFSRDRDASADEIVKNGRALTDRTLRALQHLVGPSNDPVTMSMVPLFHFYARSGRYVRSQFYGFISWLMIGSDQDVRNRKLVFSAHRGRLEQILYDHDIPGAITARVGSGMRAVSATVQFYQEVLVFLSANLSPLSSQETQAHLKDILAKITSSRVSQSAREGRQFDDGQKSAINVRELFQSAVRCEICGGILDLGGGVQYDHNKRYADSGPTQVENGRPTHPFCNNQRDAIERLRAGAARIELPPIFSYGLASVERNGQMSLFRLLQGETFPDD